MSETLSILILEDNTYDAELEIAAIEDAGFVCEWTRVDTKHEFEEAIKPPIKYDLIIADYNLPSFDGLSALKIVLENKYDLPFILVSGTVGEETAIESLKSGATDYVLKDRLSRMGPVVKRALQEKEEQRKRKKAEEELLEINTALVNTMPGIARLDANQMYTHVNEAFADMLGYTINEMIGKMWEMIIAPEYQAKAISAHELMLKNREAEFEVKAVCKNGRKFFAQILLVKKADDGGEYIGHHCFMKNISERKQLEEQLRLAQKMEAVGQLTAGIAHDFNNLLTAINGSAQLLQIKLPKDDPLKRLADRIVNSGQHAANLISQLMAFSRKQVVEPRFVNLNEIVKQIETMLRRIIGEHIILKTILAPDLWGVKVDPAQFEQVVVNLAVNARDAMPNGGELTIETTNLVLTPENEALHFQGRYGEFVLLTIKDSGIGLSKEVQARIFEPFFTTKELGEGTGLGLAIVYGIVQQNKGDIQVFSEAGTGTTFKIYLPKTQGLYQSHPRLKQSTEIPTGKETILLVEDASGVRELVLEVLQMQGYTVLEAQNAAEAKQIATSFSGYIDLLLTDVVMPGISGKALADDLSQSHPTMKVIFMSGYTDDVIAHHGVLEPDTAFLQKPFNPMTLGQKIRQIIDS